MHPHKKKSSGLKSEKRGGRTIEPLQSIQVYGKLFNQLRI
jgi:hypothetical protein